MRAWDLFLEAEYKKPYFTSLHFFLAARRTEGVVIYPSEKELFASFELTPFEKIKVVLLRIKKVLLNVKQASIKN